ncbi:hypothetical protein BJY01DRAFT_213936 [Aspergillus pseudoustus]|uniref:Uncharacterized protein n=1 Tax=Aspergillus pseudoustus TaxID=1810923 RepID=A0ABR4K060_9EURO
MTLFVWFGITEYSWRAWALSNPADSFLFPTQRELAIYPATPRRIGASASPDQNPVGWMIISRHQKNCLIQVQLIKPGLLSREAQFEGRQSINPYQLRVKGHRKKTTSRITRIEKSSR